MDEIKQLEFEIKVLKEKVSYLEKKELRRRNLAIFKFAIGLIIVIIIFIFVYDFYQKIMDFYNSFPFHF